LFDPDDHSISQILDHLVELLGEAHKVLVLFGVEELTGEVSSLLHGAKEGLELGPVYVLGGGPLQECLDRPLSLINRISSIFHFRKHLKRIARCLVRFRVHHTQRLNRSHETINVEFKVTGLAHEVLVQGLAKFKLLA
jgi:hypothetical protein